MYARSAWISYGLILAVCFLGLACSDDREPTGSDSGVPDQTVTTDGKTTADSSPCGPGATLCSGQCTNTSNDNKNCGACGTACKAGEVCAAGTCGLTCPTGFTNCSGKCVDLKTDVANCGKCDGACKAGEVCAAGTCGLTCPTGFSKCSGKCVDTNSDSTNCGACATACKAGEVCTSGSCTLSCPTGFTNCAGTCVNLSNDAVNCGKCGELCQYSAIVCLRDSVLTFEQLCHSCGGCKMVCPTGAISEKPKIIGSLEIGRSGKIDFAQGRLEIGDVRTPALIKKLKQKIIGRAVSIIDAPPGTSCPVIEAVRDADFALLVTEPTPFGLNDLKLAVEMLRQLKLPFAVMINRSRPDEKMTNRYCEMENIEVIFELPDDRRIAEEYSVGQMIIQTLGEYKKPFEKLAKTIEGRSN